MNVEQVIGNKTILSAAGKMAQARLRSSTRPLFRLPMFMRGVVFNLAMQGRIAIPRRCPNLTRQTDASQSGLNPISAGGQFSLCLPP